MSEDEPKAQPKPRAKRTYHPKEGQPVDKAVFEGLCRIDCTHEELSAVLGCSISKIEKWVRQTYGAKLEAVAHHFRHEQNARYRKRQDELALQSKNPEMLKFIGKVRLGQGEATQKRAPQGARVFQLNIGVAPKQLDGPPPAPVRKLINCGDAKLTTDAEDESNAATWMAKARESIDGELAED